MERKVVLRKTMQIATVAGAAVLVVGAGMSLVNKSTSVQEKVMSAVAILVGVSAFSYAMNDQKNAAATKE